MNQIITLLSNLFNLTKVASVTLPGLLGAGGLLLVLWPAVPVDLVPLAVSGLEHPKGFPSDSPYVQSDTFDVNADRACPGENVLGRHGAYDQACMVKSLPLEQILESDHLREGDLQPASGDIESLGNKYGFDAAIIGQIWDKAQNRSYPQSRRRQVQEQLILDFENQRFSECINLETSLKGREDTENLQLKADLAIEEQQRSAAQDNFLAYLKSNNLLLANRYRTEMERFQACISLKRYSVLWNEGDSRERDRRLAELTRAQAVITARLADPGRLRPRLGFDDFTSALVNHVVAFILLSLAVGMAVTAFNRAVFFGGLFEDLFDGL